MQIGHEKTHALLDTGASISCIEADFFSKLQNIDSIATSNSDLSHIRGIGGETHEVSQKVLLPLSVAGHKCPHYFYVVSGIQTPLLLGLDFCQKYQVDISFSQKRVTIKEQQATVNLITPASCVGLCRSAARSTVPAKAETNIPVRVSRQCNGLVMFLQPSTALQSRQVLGGRCIVNPQGNRTVCRVLNTTDQDITLPAGFIVATATSVLPADISPPTEERQSGFSNLNLTDHEAMKITESLGISLGGADLTHSQKAKLSAFLGRNRDVFAMNLSELGKTTAQYHNIDTGDAPPQKQRFYRQSPEMRAETKRQIDEMMAHGIIEPSTSQWQSPVVLVKKKNGDWRFAVDYRKINSVTKPISFPLPRIEDVFDSIGEAKAVYFSVLDMASGFWQIPLSPETKHKTGFTTCHGNYQFSRLPFGLCNAPASYQSVMTSVLNGLNFQIALVYVDDVIIFSKNFEEHLHHLDLVFQRLRKAKLTLKPSKCKFAAPEVLYLGHIITRQGVKVDPNKTSAVDSFPKPKTQKELRSFLGLCNYYRRFVLDYAKIAAPLNTLLKKDTRWLWSDKCEVAFQTLKQNLVSAPILAYPNMSETFVLTTDASVTALGYILSQTINGKEHPIAYGGRATRKAEKNYSITDLECLAVLEGINAYRPYLAHRHFDVYTDHSALTSLKKMKDPKGRAARWSLTLQGYQFTVHHRPGIKNQNADALSRRQYTEQTDTNEDDSLPAIFSIDPAISVQPPGPTHPTETAEEWAELHLQYEEDPVQQNTVFTINPVLDIKAEQAACPIFMPMVEYLSTGTLPNDKNKAKQISVEANQYVLSEEGILYHLYEPRSKNGHVVIRQLAVPMSMRDQIMHDHHGELMGAGHQGFDRTYSLIRQKYYWPRMYKELQAYIKSCDSCQKAKGPHQQTTPPLTPMPIESKFHRWHMDILELATTKQGYRYVLLMVDSLTRWMEAIPLKTQEASEVASVIYRDLICRYGAPRVLVSDRGRNFLSKIVKVLCDLYKVKRHHTTAYHPQTNSCCERVNRTLGQALRAFCNKQEEWVTKLPGILMALRRTPCDRSTKHSPFLLTFGQEMLAPIDTTLLTEQTHPRSVQEYLDALVTTLADAEHFAKENCEISQKSYKKDHDKSVNNPQFKVGDRVLLNTPKVPRGKSKKLHRKWEGPYFITDLGPNYTYKLCHCFDQTEKSLVNARRLMTYQDPLDRHRHAPEVNNPPVDTPDSVSRVPQGPVPNTVTTDTPRPSDACLQGTQSVPDTSQEWYQVEKILAKQRRQGKGYYRIKWVGFKETTWEPEENLSSALIREFTIQCTEKSQRRKNAQRRRV